MAVLALYTHSSSLCKMLAHQKETVRATALNYTHAGLPPPLGHQFFAWPGQVLIHHGVYLCPPNN